MATSGKLWRRHVPAVAVGSFVAAFALSLGVHAVFATPPSGTGAGNGGQSAPQFTVTTTASDVPSGAARAFPGANGRGSLYLKASNITGMTVQVVGLTLRGDITPAGCAASLDPAAVNAWLATNPQLPNRSTVTFTVPNALALATSAASACQGATIAAPVTVTVRQVR